MLKNWFVLGTVISSLHGVTEVKRFELPVGRSLHITFVNENDHVITQYNHNAQTNVVTPSPKDNFSVAPIGQGIAQFVTTHPLLTGLGSLVCGYASLVGYLLYEEWSLTAGNGWASWRAADSLQTLQKLPPNQLAQELFDAIQERYKESADAHVLAPLICFLQAVDAQAASLNRFKTTKKWCARLRMSALLPAQNRAVAQVEDKLQRLAYFKEIVLAWLCQTSHSN